MSVNAAVVARKGNSRTHRKPDKHKTPTPSHSALLKSIPALSAEPASPSPWRPVGSVAARKIDKKTDNKHPKLSQEKPSTPTKSKDRKKNAGSARNRTHSSEKEKLSDSPKRKSKERHGSAEKDGTDAKKVYNSTLAQKFFQQYSMKRNSKRRSDDTRLEKMPDSSQINASTRELRKKLKKQPKQPLDRTIFNAVGEPVWVVHELEPEKSEKDEKGKPITNPELVQAMAEDDVSMDECDWVESGESALNGCLDEGKQPGEHFKPDPFASLAELEKENEYFIKASLIHNTAKTLGDMSRPALLRSDRFGADGNRQSPRPIAKSGSKPMLVTAESPSKMVEHAMKTCIITDIRFNLTNNLRLTYDRHHAIASIKKFRKKYGKKFSKELSLGSKEKT